MSELVHKRKRLLQEAVTLNIQSQGARVAPSERKYDHMVEVMRPIRENQPDDGFTEALAQRLDALIAQMNRPGAAENTAAVLFGAPASLNATYRPGATETAR